MTRTKVEYKNTAKFVISNSVYVNETTGKEVDAVDLTSSNIAPDATKALKNPNRTCGGYHWQYVE